MKKHLFPWLLGLVAALAGSAPVAAYEYHTHSGSKITWPSPSATMRAAAISFPSGSSYRTALDTSVDLWNDNPSDFRFSLVFDDSSVAFDNDQNEVWFTDSDYWLDGAPAVTYTWSRGDEYVEADIIADNRWNYTTSTTKTTTLGYGGSHRPFQTVMLHELGHALGLAHEDGTYNIMGQDWDHVNVNGSTLHFYAGENAVHGAVFLYGLDSTRREDVGVVHWKHSGASGEYSTHARTKIYKSSGATATTHSGTSDDPAYEVSKGEVITLEITFENNGASTQTPSVGFYLSTNDTISNGDTLLATRTPTLGRNTVYTTTQSLTIPSDLVSGTTYWLGVIVDRDGAISESNEANNATYVGIYVK